MLRPALSRSEFNPEMLTSASEARNRLSTGQAELVARWRESRDSRALLHERTVLVKHGEKEKDK